MSWPALISELQQWNQQVDALDPSRADQRSGPNAPADEGAIERLEATLGLKLDHQHRAFLQHADGWPEFSGGTISLLSTSEMLGSPKLELGTRNLGAISNVAMGKYKRQRKNLLVVGASDCTLDVVCMPVNGAMVQSTVVWFNNTEPEEFPSFEAYFRSVISHQPAVVDYFRKRGAGSGAT